MGSPNMVDEYVILQLFAGQTPNLRRLAFSFYPSWRENNFKNLTHLSLYRQHYSGRYTVAEYLDVLRDSPALEELNLVDAGPFNDSDLGAQRTVSLNSLRRLEIGERPHICIRPSFYPHYSCLR